MTNTPIGRLRAIGLTEGVSFLALLCIAMPLKYLADLPKAVQVVGWVHGILFVLYMVALYQAMVARNWPFSRVATAFVAAILPCGTFVMDARLRREEREAAISAVEVPEYSPKD